MSSHVGTYLNQKAGAGAMSSGSACRLDRLGTSRSRNLGTGASKDRTMAPYRHEFDIVMSPAEMRLVERAECYLCRFQEGALCGAPGGPMFDSTGECHAKEYREPPGCGSNCGDQIEPSHEESVRGHDPDLGNRVMSPMIDEVDVMDKVRVRLSARELARMAREKAEEDRRMMSLAKNAKPQKGKDEGTIS